MSICRGISKRVMVGLSAGAMVLGSLTLTSTAQADVNLTPRLGVVAWTEQITASDPNLFGLNGTEYPQLSAIPSGAYSLGRITGLVKWPPAADYGTAQASLISCPTSSPASCGSFAPILGESLTVRSDDRPRSGELTYVPTGADVGRYAYVRLRVFGSATGPVVETLSEPLLMLGTPPRDTDSISIAWQPSVDGPFVTDGSQVVVDVPRWRAGNMNFASRLLETYNCPSEQVSDFGTCTRLASQTFESDDASSWTTTLPTLTGTGFLKVLVRGTYSGETQTSFRQLWSRSSTQRVPLASQATIRELQAAQDQAAQVAQTCRDVLGPDAGTLGADPALNQAFTECLQNGGPTAEQLANQANGNGADPADPNADNSTATPTTTSAATAAIAASGARVVDSTATRAGTTMTLASVRAIKRGRRLIAAVAINPGDAASKVTLSIHRCKKVSGKRDCTRPGKRVQGLKRINVTDGIGVRSSKVRKKTKPGRYVLRAIVRDANGKGLVVSAQPLRIRK